MVKKLFLVGCLVLPCLTGSAQKLPDSVIMTIGDKQVPLSEFEYIAHKNNEVDFSSEQSIKNYVELFKNFKLKVVEAEQLDLDKTPAFESELEEYKTQLFSGYLVDKKGEEATARALHEKGNEYWVVSQILLPFQDEQCITGDTVPLYEKALEIYNRIRSGADFDTLGIALYNQTREQGQQEVGEGQERKIPVYYEYIPRFLPMQKLKAFEDAVYATAVGEVSVPIRTADGFHLIKVQDRRPNFRSVQVAYINIPYQVDSIERTPAEVLKDINEAYERAKAGEDFGALVHAYSVDTVDNGILSPPFLPGELLKPIEERILALAKPGDFTAPIVNEQAAYIFALVEKKERESFDAVKNDLISDMSKTERNFDLYKSFDDYLKKAYNYTLYPAAYAELEKLCDDYFPSSKEFLEKSKEMNKTLVRLNGEDFPQKEFAYYIQKNPFSAKTYSKDFLNEVFALFVRDIATMFERKDLEVKYPEIAHLLQEYRDGILLFEISNKKIWNQPMEEQAALEAAWLKELNAKYPVTVNAKSLKKLKSKRR